MKINTNNYEEFFLLYIDNELTAEQRAAVDTFTQENPTYQKELVLLQKTIQSPIHLEFEDKISLYRFDEMEASLPSSFKQSLYRNEAKVVTGFFRTSQWRLAAGVAAIVLLFIGYQFIDNLRTSKHIPTQLASGSSEAQKNKINNALSDHTIQLQNQPVSISNFHSAQQDIKVTAIQTTIASASNNFTTYNENENTEEIPKALADEAIVASNNKSIEKNITNTKEINEKTIVPTEPISVAAVESKTAYENINTDDADKTIYIANLEIDGDRLRGISRRIGAFFKKNKTEKEK